MKYTNSYNNRSLRFSLIYSFDVVPYFLIIKNMCKFLTKIKCQESIIFVTNLLFEGICFFLQICFSSKKKEEVRNTPIIKAKYFGGDNSVIFDKPIGEINNSPTVNTK